jgi:hypothetical protein
VQLPRQKRKLPRHDLERGLLRAETSLRRRAAAKPSGDSAAYGLLVILSGALQRNAKHEARLSNISGFRPVVSSKK